MKRQDGNQSLQKVKTLTPSLLNAQFIEYDMRTWSRRLMVSKNIHIKQTPHKVIDFSVSHP